MNDDDITLSFPRGSRKQSSIVDLDHQISALTGIVSSLSEKVHQLMRAPSRLDDGDPSRTGNEDGPAPWVVFTPAPAAEDHIHRADNHTPMWTLENFVSWYNNTYAGVPGAVARPIPACWHEHPGLAQEVGSLAYSWLRSNVGPAANVRDAQHWHHQWRTGFAARLGDWVHPHCLDGRHRPSGAQPRADRFSPVSRGSPEEGDGPTT